MAPFRLGRGLALARVWIRLACLSALAALLLSAASAGVASAASFTYPVHGSHSETPARVAHAIGKSHVTLRHHRLGPSTARPGASLHFAFIRSRRDGKQEGARHHATARNTEARLARSAPPTEQGTITFSEFPDGSPITNQYQPNGIDFSGDSPFIADDGSNPTSPVLSGTPRFFGTITGTFVQPDGTPRTVGNFSLDVGFIDTSGSTEVIAYDSSGNAIDTVPIEDTGIVNVSISVPGIASFSVQAVDPGNPDSSGFAIDNVAFLGYSFIVGPPTASEQGAGPNESEHGTTCYVLEPVNCATGTLVSQYSDISIPGRGIEMSLTRAYSSASAGTDNPFGFGWTDNYAMSLNTDASGDVTIDQEDGSAVTFQPNGSGGLVAPNRVLASLVQNSDGTYTFTRDSTQDAYDFSASGQLVSEMDRNGYITKLTYNSSGHLITVTDPAGRQLTFTYSGPHIATVTDPVGRTWTYSYDADGNLATATDPMGRTWSFTYDSRHLMLTITDPRGEVTTNTYNSNDQVASQTDPIGATTTWVYSGDPTSAAGGTTTMTDPNGNVTIYDYATLELMSITRASGTSDAASTSYIYDPSTLGVSSVTDPNGNVSTNTYDSSGNLLTTTDPLGDTTSYSYNSFNEVLTKTSPLGETTTNTYDGNGNLLTLTDPLGGVTSYTYGDSGHPGDVTAITDADGNVAKYAYDSDGDVASATVSPTPGVADTTAYVYDANGERTCEASPNATAAGVTCPATGSPRVGNTTSTVYDADGEITSVTDPDGHTTRYAYDGSGNKTQITNASAQVTKYAYNGDNQQTKVTQPNGTTLSGNYDANGNLTSQANAAGQRTSYTYDALDQVASATSPRGETTSYTYDPAGNRTSLTDPAGQVTSYTYDAANEMIGTSYSDGSTPDVSYDHDADGQRSDMHDGTGTTSYRYDANGHLASVTNGAGATVSYAYDPAGQLAALTYPNGQTVTRTYNGARQLTKVTDWLGNTTKFVYDADGNLTGETYPNGISAITSFDNADQLIAITDKTASGTLASFSYARNSLGQITSDTETGAVSVTQDYSYNQLSQLASDSKGSYAYDKAGDLTQMPGGITQAYNADSELTSTTRQVSAKPAATDQVVSANETTKAAKITSSPLTTKAANELIVAFISADGPSNMTQRITGVSGGGLTWSRPIRANSERGTAEVWQAHATRVLKAVKITATLNHKGYDGSITIATFTGSGSALGAHAAAGAASGRPAVSVTTTGPDSLVWAVGEDSQHSTARTAVSGQSIVHQYSETNASGTSWVQKTPSAAKAKTNVKVADSAPRSDRWEFAAVEITSSGPRTSSTAYGYDARGDRTGVTPQGQARIKLTYDQANRLTGYGTTATYGYNGDGLRMSKTVSGTTTSFAWDQSESTPLLLTGSPSTYFIYGPDGRPIEQIIGSAPTYFQGDQQGSVRLITNSAGKVIGTYTYGAYGTTIRHTGTGASVLQYDGQYTDAESGFQYLQNRHYDPSTGQFLSQDPLVAATQAPYQYAGGSPLTFTDPSGLIPLACDQLASLASLSNDLGNVLGSFGDLAKSLGERASILGYLLRYGSTPEIRSYAAGLLRQAGELANSGPLQVIRRFAPAAGATVGFAADLLNGDSVGRAGLQAGGSYGLGAAGAAVGSAACGAETVASFGAGALACPILITAGAAGGAYIGRKIGGWAADLLHW
jgi:RHS repeat-associated protein